MSENAFVLTSTEFARELSDVLNRVRYQGASFIIERGGEACARLVPVAPIRFGHAELETLFASLTRPDAAYLVEIEAITRNQPLEIGTSWES